MRRSFSLALIALVSAAACGEDGSGADGGGIGNTEARRAVAASLGRDVLLPTYRDFERAAVELETAAGAWAGSLSDADREAARQAWVDAMAVWQKAELMQVGPAGMGGTAGVPGGRDLRDEIYSWPVVDRCRVDQEIVMQDYTDPAAFASELPNVRGLDTMEYLLFREDFDNACSSLSSINADGTWAALSEEEIASRRAQYAHTVAIDVHDRATELLGAWEPDDGDFLAELETAGEGSEVYPSAQAALNGISDAMFYLDKTTKDMKLAEPAAISMECLEPACPEDVESRWAHRSKSHVADNLRGFRLLLLGADGGAAGGDGGAADALGFDDLLRELGAGDLADEMVAKVDAAIEAVEAIEGTLAEAVQTRREQVVAAHAAVKAITDLLKADFVTVLDLERPAAAEGDND